MYIIHLVAADEVVDTRPILPQLLAAHSTAPHSAHPASLPSTQPAAILAADPRTSAPSAVIAALSLPADSQEDALTNALRDWATREPERALVFSKSLRTSVRAGAIQTVLETLGNRPALALKIGRELLVEEPDQGAVYGSLLINVLTSAKEFTTALEFAKIPGVENSRTDWTADIIGQWTRAQPEMAAELSAIVSRPGTPESVIQAFTAGWASTAPSAAAEFVLALPTDEKRQGILALAVSEWVNRDPTSAADWINNRLKAGPEFDQALAMLLTQTPREFYSAQIALDRTISISDPTLRAATRVSLMRSWADVDRAAALNYLQLAKEVGPQERGQLFAELTQPSASVDQGEPQRVLR